MESINRPSLSMSMASTLAETTTENKTKMDDYYRPKSKLTLSIASASTLTKAATAIEIENRNKMDDYYRPKPKLSLSVAATSTKPAAEIENGIVDYPPKLSLPEKRKLATTLIYLVGFTGYHSVAALFRGKKGAKYYFIHVVHAIVRESIRSMTCREWQYVGGLSYSFDLVLFFFCSIRCDLIFTLSGDFPTKTFYIYLPIHSDIVHIPYGYNISSMC